MTDASSPRTRARPSMADVGALAEVSAQTVSRYYTGGYVGSETRTRIEQAVERLGYRHNRVARNLRLNSTDTIGVLIMGPVNYGNASILTGLSTAARASSKSLIISQLDIDTNLPSSLDEVRHALDNFMSFQVDGIIVGTPFLGTEKLLEYIGESVPIVTLSGVPSTIADSAAADSWGAGLTATRHLIDLGHRRILHLAGPSNRTESSERLRGYRQAMTEAGLEPLPEYECSEWDADSGADFGRIADPTRFTAVFAANDLIALGFMRAMADRGVRVPDDYSIIGIDDMPEVAYYSPALSSVGLDFENLGRSALRMILERLSTGERQPRSIIPGVLAQRESTVALAHPSAG